MPTWGEILAEVQASAATRGGNPDFDGIRRKYLAALNGLTQRDTIIYYNLGATIEVDSDISLRLQPDIRQVGSDEEPFRLYYPALSVPLGTEDELVCPEQHVKYLKEITGHYDPLDVLVIGYSGLDQEALNLMSWGGRPIRSLWIVSESEPTAQATADRITAKLNVVPATGQNAVTLLETGFTNFAHGSGLDEYIERIRAVAATEDERRSAVGYR